MARLKAFSDVSKFSGCPVGFYVRAVQGVNGIDIRLTNNLGETVECGNLLTICNDGVVVLHSGVNNSVDFKLDAERYLIVRKAFETLR